MTTKNLKPQRKVIDEHYAKNKRNAACFKR